MKNIKKIKRELKEKGYYNIVTRYNLARKPFQVRAENHEEIIAVWGNGLTTYEEK